MHIWNQNDATKQRATQNRSLSMYKFDFVSQPMTELPGRETSYPRIELWNEPPNNQVKLSWQTDVKNGFLRTVIMKNLSWLDNSPISGLHD